MQSTSDGRLLRFTTSIGNVGVGPLEVRPDSSYPCPTGEQNATQIIYRDANANGRYNRTKDTGTSRHSAGCMVYHTAHEHWHFEAAAQYTLLDPDAGDRVVISEQQKVSFCLMDSTRLSEWDGSYYRETYDGCGKRTAQGIGVGWVDVYKRYLAGQHVALPSDLPDGVYCLETTVNPLNLMVESQTDNNTSVRALRIRGTRVYGRDSSYCD